MNEPTVEERFWAKVHKTDTCWVWTAKRNGRGYGSIKINRKWHQAHRVAYTLTKGEIPDGYHVDHLCRNTSCVNPDHLEAVTPRENYLRGISVMADNARKTECDYGHPLSGDNLAIRRDGSRQCRICLSRRSREYRERKRDVRI